MKHQKIITFLLEKVGNLAQFTALCFVFFSLLVSRVLATGRGNHPAEKATHVVGITTHVVDPTANHAIVVGEAAEGQGQAEPEGDLPSDDSFLGGSSEWANSSTESEGAASNESVNNTKASSEPSQLGSQDSFDKEVTETELYQLEAAVGLHGPQELPSDEMIEAWLEDIVPHQGIANHVIVVGEAGEAQAAADLYGPQDPSSEENLRSDDSFLQSSSESEQGEAQGQAQADEGELDVAAMNSQPRNNPSTSKRQLDDDEELDRKKFKRSRRS